MFGCLSSLFFYTFLTGYLFVTFGYVFAISESLSLERTDDIVLAEESAFAGGSAEKEGEENE